MTPQKPETLIRDAPARLPWIVEIRRNLHRFPELRGTTRKRSALFLRLTLGRTACVFWIVLATLANAGRAAPAATGEQPRAADVPARMLPLLRAIQSRELEELYQEQAARATLEQAGVELGTWYRIGPLRDQPPLLNWMENSASSFAHRFEVERDALDRCGLTT